MNRSLPLAAALIGRLARMARICGAISLTRVSCHNATPGSVSGWVAVQQSRLSALSEIKAVFDEQCCPSR
ncbi:MAG: hypothetical protein MUC44_06080 [Beijerinckiaceae bacterium]|jgi:hypothetical protein|nr:hypothetical protein [Beijerinckiaceae bacterium]